MLTSDLEHLDALIDTLTTATATTTTRLSDDVRHVTVLGRVLKSKGYGVRVQKVLRECRHVRRVQLVGIDDLRPKHVVSPEGRLRRLELLNSSFRPHSLVEPPTLHLAVSNLTHLTLSNLGLPSPATHVTTIVKLAQSTLEYLAISSIRDLDQRQFRTLFATLARDDESRLETLVLGFLTDPQVDALSMPRIDNDDDDDNRYPVLSRLGRLKHLTFTLPHPSLELVLSIPPNLEVLTIRPPYSRYASSLTTASSSRKQHSSNQASLLLLASLNPVPSPALGPASTTNSNGNNTPTTTAMMTRRRTRSIPLELLEEEETILSHLCVALLSNPPNLVLDYRPSPSSSSSSSSSSRSSSTMSSPCTVSTSLTMTKTLSSSSSVEQVRVLRKGQRLIAERTLSRIRWECNGLRGGKERVQELMREREAIKQDSYNEP
ncbi:hypothetical protein JCM3766R1_000716 [Sporobolomyces carnicolor]